MNRSARRIGIVLWPLTTAALAAAQTTTRVTLTAGGVAPNDQSYAVSLSADGRFAAFWSGATNIVAGDINDANDVFIRDRLSGTTERASVSTAGIQGNGSSALPSLSSDGRFVLFYSDASNLVPADLNHSSDLFLRDRNAGTTVRVSVSTLGAEADAGSYNSSLSPDGAFVVFDSFATNLVAGDANALRDAYVRDVQAGTLELVSRGPAGVLGNGASLRPCVSSNGRFVAFESTATNLVTGDLNGVGDIFVRDRQTGTTERISVSGAGVEADLGSQQAAISGDGRFVAFESAATNLVAGDMNGMVDIFVRDRLNGTTQRISVSSAGVEAILDCRMPSLSEDGRYAAFESDSPFLVLFDSNFESDIFLRDLLAGTTERVSLSTAGAQADHGCHGARLTPDGRYLSFSSTSTTLVSSDTNNLADGYVRDRGAFAPTAFCMGDSSAGTCPCGNFGFFGGCDNSAGTGGAMLTSSGFASLGDDTLVLTSAGELTGVLSIFLQGDAAIAGTSFGDGLRCVGGHLRRLYAHNAIGDTVSAPLPGDLSISARALALGDPLSNGATRYYQVYYRDPQLGFCPAPQGDSWNVSSGLTAVWTW